MELLTVKETARLLRVSPITIRRYIASGRLAAERVGRGIRVRREAIEDFVSPIVPTDNTEHEDENLVEISSPSSPSGSEWVPNELLGAPSTQDDPLWNIVGIGGSGSPTNMAEYKDEYIADAILAASANEEESDPDEVLGKPFTMNDALWSIFGIGESDDATDVSENKHTYLADAYLSDEG